MDLDDDTLDALGYGARWDAQADAAYEVMRQHSRSAVVAYYWRMKQERPAEFKARASAKQAADARRYKSDAEFRERRRAAALRYYHATKHTKKRRPHGLTLMLPLDVLSEAQAEAQRLGVSVSRVFQMAWRLRANP
jgi:hypothetical protein